MKSAEGWMSPVDILNVRNSSRITLNFEYVSKRPLCCDADLWGSFSNLGHVFIFSKRRVVIPMQRALESFLPVPVGLLHSAVTSAGIPAALCYHGIHLCLSVRIHVPLEPSLAFHFLMRYLSAACSHYLRKKAPLWTLIPLPWELLVN